MAVFPLDFCWLVGVDNHKHIRSFFFHIFSFLSYPQFCARFVCTSCSQIETPNMKLAVKSYILGRVYGESYTERCGSTTTSVYDNLQTAGVEQNNDNHVGAAPRRATGTGY